MDRHDLRGRGSGDFERVMYVVEVAVGDEHQVAALNLLQLLRGHRIVHDPRVDEDLLAPGAADLPGAVPDPCEADVSVERHSRSSRQAADRKIRFSHTPKTNTAIAASVHRLGKHNSQGGLTNPSSEPASSVRVTHRRSATAPTVRSSTSGRHG